MVENGLWPRLRVAAVISREEGLLLVKHSKAGREYYLLPGGGVMRGENMNEALSREIEEETGLKVQAGKLLCVSETIFPDSSRHIVHMVFRGIERGGKLQPSRDPRVKGAEFMDFRNLGSIELLPPIGEFLQRSYRSRFEEGAVYLGELWKEL
jgi:ADP-ribose pyrophosphatase YjhB (NUDIX family)